MTVPVLYELTVIGLTRVAHRDPGFRDAGYVGELRGMRLNGGDLLLLLLCDGDPTPVWVTAAEFEVIQP
jgi:hypothetical protein